MEDPTDAVLSMDLSLNLSPPSPPPPNLGLSLGLSSTPSAAEEEEEEEQEEEEEEEEEEEVEEEEGNLRSFMPDLIWPRVRPLCPAYADPYVTASRRDGATESRGSEIPISASEEGEHGSYTRVRCRLRRLTSILEESNSSAMRSSRSRHTFSPPPSPPSVPLPFPSCGFCSGDPCLNVTAPKEADDGDYGIEKETGPKGEGNEPTQIANFECNICLELAREPVVTMCGHLFCWPCLYQWLHLYSTCKECPVCKGVVTDKNVTPIYGRGVNPYPNSPQTAMEEEEEGKEALPPRPRALRVESWRQRERDRDRDRIGVTSLSRRVEEIIRFRNTRRFFPRLTTNQNENENRPHGSIESSPDDMLSRLRATRYSQRRREGTSNFGQGLGLRDRLFTRRFRGRSPEPSVETRASAEEEEEGHVFGDLAFDRMAAIRARLASMEGMLETFAGLNPPITGNPDLAAASASSSPVLLIPATVNPWSDDGRLSGSASASAALIDRGFLREETAVSEAESSSLLFSRIRDAQSASGGGASESSDVEGSFRRRRKIQRV